MVFSLGYKEVGAERVLCDELRSVCEHFGIERLDIEHRSLGAEAEVFVGQALDGSSVALRHGFCHSRRGDSIAAYCDSLSHRGGHVAAPRRGHTGRYVLCDNNNEDWSCWSLVPGDQVAVTTESAALVGKLLANLHALRVTTTTTWVPDLFAHLEGLAEFDVRSGSLLRHVIAEDEPVFCHLDLHFENCIAGSGGLYAIDFFDAGFAPARLDVALAAAYWAGDGGSVVYAEALVGAYAAESATPPLSLALVAAAGQLIWARAPKCARALRVHRIVTQLHSTH